MWIAGAYPHTHTHSPTQNLQKKENDEKESCEKRAMWLRNAEKAKKWHIVKQTFGSIGEHSARLQHPIHSDNIEHIMLSMARLNWDILSHSCSLTLFFPNNRSIRILFAILSLSLFFTLTLVPSNAQAIFLASAWLECVYHKLCSFWHDITWRLFNTRMAMAFTFENATSIECEWILCQRAQERERKGKSRRIKWTTQTITLPKMPKQTNVFHVESMCERVIHLCLSVCVYFKCNVLFKKTTLWYGSRAAK